MKKTYLLFVIFLCAILHTKVAAQTVVDDFGNKIPFNEIVKEPWFIENTADPSIAITDNIYQAGNVGVGDFSTITTTQKLDVAGNIRIRALSDGTDDPSLFPSNVVAQLDGTLGAIARDAPLFQQASIPNTIIEKKATVVHIYSELQLNLTFPTTLADGAYDGRIIYVLNRQNAPTFITTNVPYYNMTGPDTITTNTIPAQTNMIFACKTIDATTVEWHRIN